MKVFLAQMNSVLGDFQENRKRALTFIEQAHKDDADLVVFPEASLFGYHPCDLLERSETVDAQLKQLDLLHKALPKGLSVLVGAFTKNTKKRGKPFYNSAVLLRQGQKPRAFHKQLLPSYDVFDEARHIEAGQLEKNTFRLKGKKVLVTICEDIWGWDYSWSDRNPYPDNPLKPLKKQGPFDLVINLSASPFSKDKLEKRQELVAKTARHFKAPTLYVNLVGAQDELIFDGQSFACDTKGRLICQLDAFSEDADVIQLKKSLKGGLPLQDHGSSTQMLSQALILGLSDFTRKAGIGKVHLGLSGGIDSAVVAALAAKAVGGENLTCVALPGPFNSPDSLASAKQLASNLGANFYDLSIEPAYNSLLDEITDTFGEMSFSLMHENLQARLRGLLLMAYSNRFGSLLLNTSNKSEFAVGYSTLYGDQCGGLSVIGDLLKREVYQLARFFNEEQEVIPSFVIDRAPSAELAPNQKDQDSLPEYEDLDRSVERIVEQTKKARTSTEKWVLEKLMQSEFKRWQAPPVLKVSNHAFGRGRRLPIAQKSRS